MSPPLPRPAALLRTVCVALACAAWWPAVVPARPLDGTDANVQSPGLYQLELGLADLRGGDQRMLTAPVAVLTYGLPGDTELAVSGQFSRHLGERDDGQHRVSLGGTGISFKHQFRKAGEEGGMMPGVAASCGLLLPEAGGDSAIGAGCSGIVSHTFAGAAAHLNLTLTRTRVQTWSRVLGLIIEGRDVAPGGAVPRPVMEMWSQRENGGVPARSLLAGAVWKRSEQLAFDAAVRHERGNGRSFSELRLGLTWIYCARRQ